MSAQQIIEELSKLDPDELRMVRARLDELTAQLAPAEQETGSNQEPISKFLLRLAGCVHGLPSDLARNHDHYLYGTPKRTQE